MANIRFPYLTWVCPPYTNILNIVFHGSSISAGNIEIKLIGYHVPGFAGCQQSNVITYYKHQDVHGFTLVQQKVFSRRWFYKILLVMKMFRKVEEALCLVYIALRYLTR
ncbi:hypothetical protein T4A_328 [Trichinella pseudospiralis]|uniref:Uncharacterized protein n=1 Tax=Trichinella pseudospiralis TaxID=6337 RepID=A0A0V1F4A5_TRIPS|nr:hypothetical protein T4A_328 [Trichinella pseudospiralis]